jgi:hypothetical protein
MAELKKTVRLVNNPKEVRKARTFNLKNIGTFMVKKLGRRMDPGGKVK